MTKRFATIAAAAITAVGATFVSIGAAQAEDAGRILTSNTWKPGYTKDDGNTYVRFEHGSTGDAARQVTAIEQRDTWAPGFENNGEGSYQRIVSRTEGSPAIQVAEQRRDTWAPGYLKDDSGYVRVTYRATGSTVGSVMLAEAPGDHAEADAEAR